jgi:hypothetical protein
MMADNLSLSQEQLSRILSAIESLKPSGSLHFEAMLPVFFSALFAMVVGILLDDVKRRRDAKVLLKEKQVKELQEINIATVALAYNLEVLIHFVFQNIVPHYEDSFAAHRAFGEVHDDVQLHAFMGHVDRFQNMMTTSPELNLLEHPFLDRLPFVLEREPELLKKANWLIHQSRVLRSHLRERNSQIELARAQSLQRMEIPTIGSAIQVQLSISAAECVAALQVINLIPTITQTLERVGRTYKGKLSTLIPPPVLASAVAKLRAIAEPHVQAMPDRQAPDGQ